MKFFSAVAIFVLMITQVSQLFSQIPETMTYQGVYAPGGVPSSATINLRFRIYDDFGTASELWTEDHLGVQVTTGVFTLTLGSSPPTALDMSFNKQYYMKIWLLDAPGTSEIELLTTTSIVFTTVPYAFRARGLVGYGSTAEGDWATVGGFDNNGDGEASVVAGGSANSVESGGSHSAIGGGMSNRITASNSTVSGGFNNEAHGVGGTIGGGERNVIAANFEAGTIAGGKENQISATSSFIGGGESNRILDLGPTAGMSVIGGGWENTVTTEFGVIAGGHDGKVEAPLGFIGGGGGNQIGDQGDFGSIAGGNTNIIKSSEGSIGGGSENLIDGPNLAQGSTIGGGSANQILSGTFSFIGGGSANSITMAPGSHATIAGGGGNKVEAEFGAISGGQSNEVAEAFGFVGGGEGNSIGGGAHYGVVAGGLGNVIEPPVSGSAVNGTIGGGEDNLVSSDWATVPGGSSNVAAGGYSFAAGRRAKANHLGSFAWADATDADFPTNGDNQFIVRASGGFGLGTSRPQAQLHIGQLPAISPPAYTAPAPPFLDGVTPLLEGMFIQAYTNDNDGFRRYADIASVGYHNGAFGGSVIRFLTNNSNSSSVDERMRIDRDGKVGINTASPNSTLHLGGSLSLAVTTVTASLTLDATHCVVFCNGSSGPFIITLPAASGVKGRVYYFRRVDSISNSVELASLGGLIEGQTTLGVGNSEFYQLISDGSNWYLFSHP